MITLTYLIKKNRLPTALQLDRLNGLTLDQGEFQLLGLIQDSDNSTDAGANLSRILVLSETPRFLLENPTTAAQLGAVKNLFNLRLSRMLLSRPVTSSVVIA